MYVRLKESEKSTNSSSNFIVVESIQGTQIIIYFYYILYNKYITKCAFIENILRLQIVTIMTDLERIRTNLHTKFFKNKMD